MLSITECPFCHKELPKTNRYRHFPNCRHADSKLPCDECSKLVCVRHYPRHRMSCGSERIECKQCGKAISKSNMKRHSKNMHDVKKNLSTACPKAATPAATPTERNLPWLEDYLATLHAGVLACSKEIESISTALSNLETSLVKQGLAR